MNGSSVRPCLCLDRRGGFSPRTWVKFIGATTLSSVGARSYKRCTSPHPRAATMVGPVTLKTSLLSDWHRVRPTSDPSRKRTGGPLLRLHRSGISICKPLDSGRSTFTQEANICCGATTGRIIRSALVDQGVIERSSASTGSSGLPRPSGLIRTRPLSLKMAYSWSRSTPSLVSSHSLPSRWTTAASDQRPWPSIRTGLMTSSRYSSIRMGGSPFSATSLVDAGATAVRSECGCPRLHTR